MPQLHASRLDKLRKQRNGFLASRLPYGSLKRKIVLWFLTPLIILTAVYFIMDDIVMPTITRHGSEFPLPNYVDQQLIEARIELDNLDLRFEVASEEFSPGVPRGVILSQYPVAGTKVKTGRVIKFVVSAGQKMITIPNLAGLSVRQALMDLETAGLELGEIAWAFSDTLPEKVVVFTYPPAGSEIALGAPVTLMVNHGRNADFTFVPKLVGLTLDEARTLLESKKLRVGLITTRFADDFLPETILEQSEEAGTELEINTEIDLVVSSPD